jgi:hypothetical protein
MYHASNNNDYTDYAVIRIIRKRARVDSIFFSYYVFRRHECFDKNDVLQKLMHTQKIKQ